MDMGSSFVFTDEQREKFAAELIRTPDKPLDAAMAAISYEQKDVGKCAYAASVWPSDPQIIEIQKRLTAADKIGELLPTKEQAILRIWDWTSKGSTDEKVKAMKLLAEIGGWIVKPDEDDSKAPTIPPALYFVVGEDHDKPPVAAQDNKS